MGVVRFESFELLIEPKLAGDQIGLVKMIEFTTGLDALRRNSGARDLAAEGADLFDLRTPHIVTFEEEEKILAVAPPFIRALAVLILETGMRSHCEALALTWEAIDFSNDSIQVRESKTRAGIRNIPISARCKAELMRWRDMFGPEFSPFVFPKMRTPTQPLKDVRRGWEKTLEDAKVQRFVLYNLRHTFASRLSAAGVSDLFVAQMIGHSSPSILQIYSKAIDEYRRDAVRKLEEMRASHPSWLPSPSASIN